MADDPRDSSSEGDGSAVDEVASRAAAQNQQYLELMETPSFAQAIRWSQENPLTGDFAAATFEGKDVEETIEAFARIPFGQKLYLRPTWRDLQKRPGRLDPEEYWTVALAAARRHAKRIGFRVMMNLTADFAGVVASVVVCRLMFG